MKNQSILKIVNLYKGKLSGLTDEEFMSTPPMGGWSYSEVYAHIFDSSLLSLMAFRKCASGEGEQGKTSFGAKVILFFGMLPPGKRYKVPKRLADRAKKINLVTAQQLIADFELQSNQINQQLTTADPKSKIAHPRLGLLNAKQWLRFIDIHLNHHLKQLSRIEKNMRS